MIPNPACTISCYGDVLKKKKNEERGDSALNQAWTCSLWTCPDIKQSWNLTHTSYIDLHSLARPFEGTWLFPYPSVCARKV